jgi:hypothetical protein
LVTDTRKSSTRAHLCKEGLCAKQRRYCDAFALWRSCARKACRRQRRCCGKVAGCLRRALDRVPHPEQWRARQDILKTTPRNIGAPERAARQCMPRDLYE